MNEAKRFSPINLLTMRKFVRFRTWMLAALLSMGGATAMAQQNSVTYADAAGRDRFLGSLRLSNGTVLVGGRSQNLSWVPSSVPVTTLTIPQVPSAVFDSASGINSRDTTGSIAYVLHMDANMQNILAVVRFPAGTVVDVSKIKTNTVPGAPTGDIYISGRRANPLQPRRANGDNTNQHGYYVAKLNANFLSGTPTGCEWTYDLRAQFIRNNTSAWPYFGAGSDAGILNNQPWDVTADGKLWAVIGREFSDDWSQLLIAKPVQWNGLTRMVFDTAGGLPVHTVRVNANPTNIDSVGTNRISEYRVRYPRLGDSLSITIRNRNYRVAVDSILQSSVLLKMNRGGSNMRSYSQADHDLQLNDENGNPGRKGKYPMDYFYSSPCIIPCNSAGPGYTGYAIRTNNNNTANERVVSLQVDKRTGEVYYGTSVWSTHPSSAGNQQDFEPAIVALAANGEIRWWARGYKEDAAGSPAMQLIDHVDIDYTNNHLVVVGRSIGDGVNNFWKGNELNANPGGNGFQNAMTGDSVQRSVSDVRWLAKYRMADGVILRSTYVGELAQDALLTARLTGNLEGFGNPNAGSPALGRETKITTLRVNADGTVLVSGVSSGRIATTDNAYQPMFKPEGVAPNDTLVGTNSFVRVYNADLSQVIYSSLLSNVWDPSTGNGGGTVEITDFMAGPTAGTYQAIGWQRASVTRPAVTDGGILPTVNIPAWGTKNPRGDAAVLATLSTTCTGTRPAAPTNLRGPGGNCANAEGVYIIDRVPGATTYAWAIPGTNFSGFSDTDTLRIVGTTGNGGTIRVVAINDCGTSLPTYFPVSAPTTTGRPTSLNLLPQANTSATQHCAGSTRWYRAGNVSTATNYRWVMPSTAWQPVGFNPTDTVFITGADSIQIFLADTVTRANGTLRVRAEGQCGISLPFNRAFSIARALTTAPDSIRRPVGTQAFMCAGANRTYTAGAVTGATGYLWTLPGANFSAPSLTTTQPNITVTATSGPGGIMRVQALNACGAGATKTLVVPQVAEPPVNVSISQNGTVLTVPRQFGATYQWRRNTNNISGATDTTYDAGTVTASYEVVITSCGQSITVGPVVSAVRNLTAQDINLYPNPTTGLVTMEVYSQQSEVNVRVLDVLGRPVAERHVTLEGHKTQLDLNSLNGGIYFIEVTAGTQRVLKKITKQ